MNAANRASAPPSRASAALVDAVWHGKRVPAVDAGSGSELRAMAARNGVLWAIVGSAEAVSSGGPGELSLRREAFDRNLRCAVGLLAARGCDAVLIKSDRDGDCSYGDFDLGVGDVDSGVAALAPATVGLRRSRLEPDKVHVDFDVGPAAHLHPQVAWFGVIIIPWTSLRDRAKLTPRGWLEPDAADALRVVAAHCLFQTLYVGLMDLVNLRQLSSGRNLSEAARRSSAEGWGVAFRDFIEWTHELSARMDNGDIPLLPAALPLRLALLSGLEHGASRLRHGSIRAGLRELSLRVPLMAAKRLRS